MGEHLFEYPQYYGSDGLLFSSSSQGTLRLDADSLYNYLGAKPYTAESTTDFLARICRDEVGKHTALDYYLSALLLDKKLDKFASVVEDSFFEQDTLPRYYREAIMLYKQSHPAYPRVLNDTLMIQRLQEFDKLQKQGITLICHLSVVSICSPTGMIIGQTDRGQFIAVRHFLLTHPIKTQSHGQKKDQNQSKSNQQRASKKESCRFHKLIV